VLERADAIWSKGDVWAGPDGRLPEPPSSYMRQIWACFYDDLHGLTSRDVVGVDRIAFETDYPHQDSTWPNTLAAVERFAPMLDDDELDRVLRGNAAELLHIETND
jgi:hypothetical protein